MDCILYAGSPNLFFFFCLLFLMFNKLLNFSSLTCVRALVCQGWGARLLGGRGWVYFYFLHTDAGLWVPIASSPLCPTTRTDFVSLGVQMFCQPAPAASRPQTASAAAGYNHSRPCLAEITPSDCPALSANYHSSNTFNF